MSSASTAVARNHIDLWMTGPFHAIGILRANLTSSGFGLCTGSGATQWNSAGTLDVLRGIDGNRPKPSTPVVFPGDGSTIALNRFITEYPNPMTMCGWSGNAGLPLIALMPNDFAWADSTIVGPNGPIETCTLHAGNSSDPTARAILDGDNGVIVMPREILIDGAYTTTVNTSGGSVTWSFSIDQNARLEAVAHDLPQPDLPEVVVAPETEVTGLEPVTPYRLVDTRIGKGAVRLRAGQVTKISVTDPGVTAVSANFVAIDPDGHGYLTAYNCTSEVPTVSTIGYGPGDVVANQAIVPLRDGKLCLYSPRSVDVVIDVNGFLRSGSKVGFLPATPTRVHTATRLTPGTEYRLAMTGTGAPAPAGAAAVALNVTVADTEGYGYLQVYPCGSQSSKQISTINFKPDDFRPNSVVTPLDPAGGLCYRTNRSANVFFDYAGHFGEEGLEFVAVDPIRMFDSRYQVEALNPVTDGLRLRAGQVARIPIAGVRGVPADTRAVSLNLTATDAAKPTYLTAYPCGTRPSASNVNLVPWESAATSNGVMVPLSGSGELCIYTLQDVHVVADLNGVWR